MFAVQATDCCRKTDLTLELHVYDFCTHKKKVLHQRKKASTTSASIVHNV